MSGRSNASRCVSWPEPTRNTSNISQRTASGVVLETHVVLQICQRHIAGRAVALFRDQHLDGVILLPALVHAGAVKHEYRIGVLLDGAALSQIGESRLMVAAILGRTVDLG